MAARCQQVVVGASAELSPLVSRIPGVSGCFDRWQDIPRHTTYALMSSLPGILGTEPATIPAEVPYIPQDPALVAEWAARLEAAVPRSGSRLRIGITWAGRPTHPNDYRRSLRLERLGPLLQAAQTSGAAVVSTSEGGARAPMPWRSRRCATRCSTPARSWPASPPPRRCVSNLDLVITVDSAVAHLAGALARPVWMLTPTRRGLALAARPHGLALVPDDAGCSASPCRVTGPAPSTRPPWRWVKRAA